MYFYLIKTGIRSAREPLLRLALADYHRQTGVRPDPEAIAACRLQEDRHGKPYLPDLPAVHFSISHSGRWWGCLMADVPVGLDLEDKAIRRNMSEKRYAAIAARFFSSDETAFLLAAGPPALQDLPASNEAGAFEDRFFEIWTRKEAYVKYLGLGLSAGLGSFSVLQPPEGVQFGSIAADSSLQVAWCSAAGASLKQKVLLAGRGPEGTTKTGGENRTMSRENRTMNERKTDRRQQKTDPPDPLKVALKYLRARERTEWETRTHLQKKGFEEDAVAETLETLKEMDCLSDRRYVAMFTELSIGKDHGSIRIRHALRQKGISEALIAETFEKVLPSEEERERAARIVQKQLQLVSPREPEEYKKMLRRTAAKLERMGYGGETVVSVLNRWQEERRE